MHYGGRRRRRVVTDSTFNLEGVCLPANTDSCVAKDVLCKGDNTGVMLCSLGITVRVYPSGKKTFVLSYRAQGRKRLMTLGQYGVLTLSMARDKAKRCLANIIDGKDPLIERQQQTQAKTIKALCDEYLERHAKPRKKSWKEDERRIKSHILPRWHSLKAEALQRSEVSLMHSKIGKQHPYEANRSLKLISKMFDLAERWGFVCAMHPNPARKIDCFKETKRDRWVSHQELPRLAAAIDAEPNIYIRSAIWLYLLTGVRKSELLQAKWEDINWDSQELKIPITKAGRPHYLPLSEEALTLLQQLPQLENNPYLIAGKKPGQHMVNISKAWGRIRSSAHVEDVRLHDLRRTVGSWLAQSGNSLHLIGKVLNHSNQSTTAIYARFGQDQTRDALNKHAKSLMHAAQQTTKLKLVKTVGE